MADDLDLLQLGTFEVDLPDVQPAPTKSPIEDGRVYPSDFPKEKWHRLLRTAYECVDRAIGARKEERSSAATVLAMSLTRMRKLLDNTGFSAIHDWSLPLLDAKPEMDLTAARQLYAGVISDLEELQMWCEKKGVLTEMKTFRGASVLDDFLLPLLQWAGVPVMSSDLLSKGAERRMRQKEGSILMRAQSARGSDRMGGVGGGSLASAGSHARGVKVAAPSRKEKKKKEEEASATEGSGDESDSSLVAMRMARERYASKSARGRRGEDTPRTPAQQQELLGELRRLCDEQRKIRSAPTELLTGMLTLEGSGGEGEKGGEQKRGGAEEGDGERRKNTRLDGYDDDASKRKQKRLLDTVSLSLTGGLKGTLPELHIEKGKLTGACTARAYPHPPPATAPSSMVTDSEGWQSAREKRICASLEHLDKVGEGEVAGESGGGGGGGERIDGADELKKLLRRKKGASSVSSLISNPSFDQKECNFLKELPEFRGVVMRKKQMHKSTYEKRIEKAAKKRKDEESLLLLRQTARVQRIDSTTKPIETNEKAFEAMKKKTRGLTRSMSVKMIRGEGETLLSSPSSSTRDMNGGKDGSQKSNDSGGSLRGGKGRFGSMLVRKGTFKNMVMRAAFGQAGGSGAGFGTNDDLIESVFMEDATKERVEERDRVMKWKRTKGAQPADLRSAEDILQKPPTLRSSKEVSVLFDRVSHLNFFRNLRKDVCMATCRVMTFKHLPAGDFLFRYGDTGTSYYIILKGSVDLLIPSADYDVMRKDQEREVEEKEEEGGEKEGGDEKKEGQDSNVLHPHPPPHRGAPRSHNTGAEKDAEPSPAGAPARRRRGSIMAVGKMNFLGANAKKRRGSITSGGEVVETPSRRSSLMGNGHAAAAAAASLAHEQEKENAGDDNNVSARPPISSRARRRPSIVAAARILSEAKRVAEKGEEGQGGESGGTGAELTPPHGRRQSISSSTTDQDASTRTRRTPDIETTLSVTDDVVAKVAEKRVGHNVVNTLKIGAAFGEIALLKDVPRTASVLTREDTIFMVVDKKDYMRVLKAEAERQRKDKITLLRRTPGFSKLPNYVYAGNLITIMEEVTLPCRVTLVEEGTYSPDIYIIKKGNCRVCRHRTLPPLLQDTPATRQQKARTLADHAHYYKKAQKWSTEEIQIAELGEGDMIGLEAFLYSDDKFIRESVITSTECDLLRVKVAELFHQVHRKYRGTFKEYFESRLAFHEERFDYLQRTAFKGEKIEKILSSVKRRIQPTRKDGEGEKAKKKVDWSSAMERGIALAPSPQ